MKQYKCFCCDKAFHGYSFQIEGKDWCPDCIKEREYIANLIDGIEDDKDV